MDKEFNFENLGDMGELDLFGEEDNLDLDGILNNSEDSSWETTEEDEESEFKGSTIEEEDKEIEELDLDKLSEEDLSNLSLGELDKLLGENQDSIDETEEEAVEEKEGNEGISTSNTATISSHDDFINENGEIVVMDELENGDNFLFKYIDIENIASLKRIRMSNTNTEDLAKSIKSTGLLEPLVVAPTETEGLYVLLAGYRRLKACAKIGKRNIPCIVNLRASTPEIPVLEALYNHSKKYSITEQINYIEYLEKQKGIMSASMIEYLLQMNSGDYTKLKDILDDNDDDIVSKLYDGTYDIAGAFKALEKRRKKESADERDNKKAARVYEEEKESGAEEIAESGDMEVGAELTEEEIKGMAFNASELDSVDDESIEELAAEGNNIKGYEAHKQDYKHRERLDPAIRKAVLARDNNTCQICKMGGQEYIDVLDNHHIQEVYLGGTDAMENLITACTVCHKLVHLYGRGDLHMRPIEEMEEKEKEKFKRIIKLGNVIRKGLAAKGMKRDELKKVDKADTIGRTKPGTGQEAG